MLLKYVLQKLFHYQDIIRIASYFKFNLNKKQKDYREGSKSYTILEINFFLPTQQKVTAKVVFVENI